MGQQAFGKACLESIIKNDVDDVVAVYCAQDIEGKPLDPVKEYALDQRIPVVQPPNFKDGAVLDSMKALNSDLCVMAFVTIFVPEVALNIPTNGSICFHPSLLPKHRGPSSINWAVISGAQKTGLTVFWPNDGLDEGDILLQKEVDIGPEDTLGTVYFQKIFPIGVEAILESIELVRNGNAPRIKQDESLATYESWCRHEQAEINWNNSLSAVYNLIRGCNPQPGAWTTLNGVVLKIYDCSTVDAEGNPGEIVQLSDEGFTVAVNNGGILVQRVRPDNDKKMAAREYVNHFSINKGTILGSRVPSQNDK